jgi:hypothetical protein
VLKAKCVEGEMWWQNVAMVAMVANVVAKCVEDEMW